MLVEMVMLVGSARVSVEMRRVVSIMDRRSAMESVGLSPRM